MASLGRIFASTVLLLGTGCSVGADDDARPAVDRAAPMAGSASYAVNAASPLRVVAVGDIACPPGSRVTRRTCRHSATAALARRLDPDLVLTLGDNQYERGTLAQFRGSYAPTWGRLLSRTRPAPGNHEYKDRGARGYYSYFGNRQPGPPGYYRVRANNWQVFVLNSNCGRISCRAQASWLSRAMTANPSRCSAIVLHHPRYSSGEHGNQLFVRRLWAVAYAHHNDVVLSGHDHDYERFRPMDNRGRVNPPRGMVEFVSGAGGKSLFAPGTRKAGSAYFQARAHGVLYLDLRDTRYSWAFRSIHGQRMESGSRPCVA